jgi:hypothetical protein
MNAADKPIIVFGDESHSNEIVTFAFFIVPALKMDALDLALRQVKIRYGLPEDVRIHCREMFNEHARAKTAFAKFSTEHMLRFLNDLMQASFDAGARGVVGHLNAKNAPDKFLMGPWQTVGEVKPDEGPLEEFDASSLKVRMMFCYYAATASLSHCVAQSKIKAYVDGDSTKIPYFDNKRRKVDGLRSFFGLDTSDARFEPEIVRDIKPPPLDLADVLAYASARALSKTASRNRIAFDSIVAAIQAGRCEVQFNDTDPNSSAMRFGVYDPGDLIKSYLNQFV